MTTVLLSGSTNTLYGIGMSENFGPLTKRLEHPTSPVLLTKNGPLRTLIQRKSSLKKPPHLTHLKFENGRRLFQPPDP